MERIWLSRLGPAEFFDVFARYNAAIWPAQITAYALGAVAVLALWTGFPHRRRVILGILSAFWAWNRVADDCCSSRP